MDHASRKRDVDNLRERLDHAFPLPEDALLVPTVLRALLDGQEDCARDNAEILRKLGEHDELFAGLKTAITRDGIARAGARLAPFATIGAVCVAFCAWVWKHFH